MQIGAVIESGPQNWQIIQQKDGRADIRLSGRWIIGCEHSKGACVYARVVSEDSSDIIIPWISCANKPENRWECVIKDVPAGGLYRIETCLRTDETVAMEWAFRGDMLHHIGVGDIFVIAGQSNSAGYGKDPAYDPPEIGVHILKNSGVWDLASHPLNDSTGTVHEINRDNWNTGASPWLSFAKFYKKESKVPVGLIQCALGGSELALWNPEENGSLYRNMLDLIGEQPGGVRGILWYQGCEDTVGGRCDTYFKRFESFVSHLRQDTGCMELPIFTFQLNRYTRFINLKKDIYWGKVREAQRQAAIKIPYVFICPTIGCSLSDAVHSSAASGVALGQRLAKIALSHIYGIKYFCMAPSVISAKAVGGGDSVKLNFENVCDRLYFYEAAAEDLPFTIEDAKGSLKPASYKVNGSIVTLTLPRRLEGESVIHCASEQNPRSVIPVDYATHLPVLCFYGVKIENRELI